MLRILLIVAVGCFAAWSVPHTLRSVAIWQTERQQRNAETQQEADRLVAWNELATLASHDTLGMAHGQLPTTLFLRRPRQQVQLGSFTLQMLPQPNWVKYWALDNRLNRELTGRHDGQFTGIVTVCRTSQLEHDSLVVVEAVAIPPNGRSNCPSIGFRVTVIPRRPDMRVQYYLADMSEIMIAPNRNVSAFRRATTVDLPNSITSFTVAIDGQEYVFPVMVGFDGIVIDSGRCPVKPDDRQVP